MKRRRGLLVTDLDGTLLGGDRRLRDCDRAALARLGRDGCQRAIATGRHMHSFGLVAAERFPVDYVVCSSGAGIYDVRHRRLLRSHSLTATETKTAVRVLAGLDLDFMVHRPIPDNHHFRYRWSGRPNTDFEGRMDRYRAFAAPLDGEVGPSAQLLAVVPADRSEPSSDQVASLLPDFTVIRTTSPLDHRSTWIEVFPREVSKSQAAAWLAARHGIRRGMRGRQRLQRPRSAGVGRRQLRSRQRGAGAARPPRRGRGRRALRRRRGDPALADRLSIRPRRPIPRPSRGPAGSRSARRHPMRRAGCRARGCRPRP